MPRIVTIGHNGRVRLLFVCTANICRSPSAAAMVGDAGLPGIEVDSAGTQALPGRPGCPAAPLLAGRADQHSSRPLTREAVARADLILTAAREHQAPVLALEPNARPRTFTIAQAGRLAQWLLDAGIIDAALHPQPFEPGDPRALVPPMPPAPQRAGWLIAELDAARGMAPAPQVPEPRRSWWRTRPDGPHPDDIPDPHVLGPQWHEPAAAQLRAALEPLLEVLRRLA